MKKFTRFCCLVLFTIFTFSVAHVDVCYALPDDKLIENAKKEDAAKVEELTSGGNTDLYESINTIVHYNFSDAEKAKKDALCESVALIIGGLRNAGFSDAAIAGILSNAKYEGCLDPFMMQNNTSKKFEAYVLWKSGTKEYGEYPVCKTGGAGLFQWTGAGAGGRRTKASDWFKANDPDYVTVTGKDGGVVYLAGSGKQIAYVLIENDWGGSNSNCSRLGVTNPGSLENFKNVSDPIAASKLWTACWERPKNLIGDAEQRAPDAALWMQVIGGNYNLSDYVSETQAVNFGSSLVTAGYWKESDLASYCKLMEIDVDDILENAKRENLNQEELNGLSIWERNVAHDIEENGLIVWVRRIIMWAGILLTIWMSLIYFAYWFDRINNLFYIDALGLLTLGHLHMSETESECTFRVKDIGKDNHKTVNHRTVIFICLVGFAFGVCIVTGVFYDFLQLIVYKIFRLLGKY